MKPSPSRSSSAASSAASSTSSPAGLRRGVCLLNFGGPRNLDEVEGFIYRILNDPNTLQFPFPRSLQNLFAAYIARRRAPELREQYQHIGGHSPIVESTTAIANALRTALQGARQEARQETPSQPGRNPDADSPACYVLHRYLEGEDQRIAARIVADGIDALLALPLYPQFSFTTSGSSLEQLAAALKRAGYQGSLEAVPSYPEASLYIDAVAAKVAATLSEQAAHLDRRRTVILCSAHGIPQAYVDRGDPYLLQMTQSVQALRQRLPEWRVELSFQSRVGPAQWLEPYTDRYLPVLAAEGVATVIFVPLAFVNDHIETLYEIGVTYADQARQLGMTPHRVAAIEAHPAFVRLLSQQIEAWTRQEAGVPARWLLPPDQYPQRYGRWLRLAWSVAFVAALLWAW